MSSNPYQNELMDIVLQLVSMRDQEAILQLALQTVRQELLIDQAGILLIDSTRQQVTQMIGQTPYSTVPTYKTVWDGLEGWVLRQQTPVLVSDVTTDVRISQQAMINLTRDGDNLSLAMAPCGEIGVILAISRQLDRKSLGLLQTLGKAVGTAIDNLSSINAPPTSPALRGDDLYSRPVGPFGQSYQQAHLLRWLGNTENGRGTSVAIEGTTGSGKTTLANWLSTQAQNRYFQVSVVTAELYKEPYSVWQQCLIDLYPTLATLSPTIDDYKRFLKNIRSDWETRAPLLVNVMTSSHVGELNSYTVRQRHIASANLILELVLEATKENSRLLIIEDGQWLDEASLDVLERISRWLQHQDVRLMLCLTTNDTAPQGCQVVQMTSLQPEHVQQLKRALIGDVEIDPAHLQTAHGNPLHIRWLLGTTDAELGHSLEELIQARIATLPPDIVTTLYSTAIIGQKCSLGALQAIHPELPSDKILRQHLRQLGIFIRETSDDIVVFRHHIYQDQARLSCPDHLRQKLHQAYGDYLERHASEQSATIAYHYQQAQLPQQARTYLVRAANTAHARHSYQDAFDYVNTALNLPGELGDMEAFALMSEQADLLRKLGDFKGQAVVLSKLTDISQQMSDAWLHAESGWRWLQHYLDTEETAEGIATWKLFLEQAEQAYHTVARAEIIITTALLYQQMGQPEETQKHLDNAAKLASQTRNMTLGARILLTLGHAFQQNFQYDLAQACFEQAMDVYLLNQDNVGIANCVTGLGQMYHELGYFENSTHYLMRARQIWQQIGNVEAVIDLTLQIGTVLLQRTLPEEAIKMLNELQQLVESTGTAMQQGHWWMLYARVHQVFNNIDNSLQCLQRAREVYPSDAIEARIELYTTLIQVAPQQQAEWVEAILALDPELNQKVYSPQVYATVADAIDDQQRAQKLLSIGREHIQTQAQKITDDLIREHYLAHPYRRAILDH